MTDIEPEKPKVSPWLWPLEWWVDEKFWRDVATRTIAGLIVVFAVWGVGIAIGVFSKPEVIEGFIRVFLVLFLLALLFVTFAQLFHGIRRIVRPMDSDPKTPNSMALISGGVSTLIFSILIILDLINRFYFEGKANIFF